jgi:hypothetical protein
MGLSQGFWETKSFAAVEDELIAGREIDSVTRRDEKGFHSIPCSQDSTHFFLFPSNPFKTSF